MNCVFRVDSSIQIGSGHVMRCLTLAAKLSDLGHSVQFICRDLEGNYIEYIRLLGFHVVLLPKVQEAEVALDWNSHAAWLETEWQRDAAETLEAINALGSIDWLIVDHYAIDYRWEKTCRASVAHIMTFDDLAESRHDCDLLLNQNFYSDLTDIYHSLVPDGCRILQGIEFALLRSEFAETRKKLRARDGQVREILVFLGGSDKDNVTLKIIRAIQSLKRPDIRVNVVLGLANPNRDQIVVFCDKHKQFNCIIQTNDIATLMANADLCVGAGGATSWERYCLGLPTLLVTLAFNQKAGAVYQAERGLIRLMGDGSELSSQEIQAHIKSAVESPEELQAMTRKTMQIVDGQGVDRVATEMINLS